MKELNKKFIVEIEKVMFLNINEESYNKIFSYVLLLLNFEKDCENKKDFTAKKFLIHTEEYKKRVLELGDSAVFAQTSKKFKTHIHTNHPGKAMEIALEYGPLEKMKIENMKLQHDNLQIFSERDEAKIFVNPKIDKTKSAFVILADSENLKDEFLKIGADVVILGGQSKNPSVQEILNAIDKTEKENVYVLPNNKNVITTAKMAAEKSQKTVMVLDTKTMLDGYYFLKNKENDIDEVKESAARNYSVEITKAVRDTKVEDLTITKDDFIALVNGKIKYAKKSLKDITDTILADLVTKNTITAVVVSGNEKDEESQKNIEEKLSGIKTVIINGNQENYYYYLYIENKDPNMPEIAILTDSVSDLTYEDIEGLPIKIVPLKIDINGELYRDGIEITKSEFWHEMLNNDATIKTSQPSPQDFLNAYNKLFEKGYKKIKRNYDGNKYILNINTRVMKRPLVIEEERINFGK